MLDAEQHMVYGGTSCTVAPVAYILWRQCHLLHYRLTCFDSKLANKKRESAFI